MPGSPLLRAFPFSWRLKQRAYSCDNQHGRKTTHPDCQNDPNHFTSRMLFLLFEFKHWWPLQLAVPKTSKPCLAWIIEASANQRRSSPTPTLMRSRNLQTRYLSKGLTGLTVSPWEKNPPWSWWCGKPHKNTPFYRCLASGCLGAGCFKDGIPTPNFEARHAWSPKTPLAQLLPGANLSCGVSKFQRPQPVVYPSQMELAINSWHWVNEQCTPHFWTKLHPFYIGGIPMFDV